MPKGPHRGRRPLHPPLRPKVKMTSEQAQDLLAAMTALLEELPDHKAALRRAWKGTISAAIVGVTAVLMALTSHLAIVNVQEVRDAGLVADEKRGYFVHYRLNENTLAEWRADIERLLDPAQGVCTEKKGAMTCAAMKKDAGSRNT